MHHFWMCGLKEESVHGCLVAKMNDVVGWILPQATSAWTVSRGLALKVSSRRQWARTIASRRVRGDGGAGGILEPRVFQSALDTIIEGIHYGRTEAQQRRRRSNRTWESPTSRSSRADCERRPQVLTGRRTPWPSCTGASPSSPRGSPSRREPCAPWSRPRSSP